MSALKEYAIYKAMGDPIRLEIVKRLSDQQPLILGDLLKDLGVTRQGARKQLQVLVDSGVVSLRPQGRETAVNLEVSALYKARDFISKLELKWEKRLSDLKKYVESSEDK